MDSKAYPQVLLVKMARPPGAGTEPASVGSYRTLAGRGDESSRRVGSGRPAGTTVGTAQFRPAARGLSFTVRSCRAVKAAGFNRRMRKTACPVVWEGGGAQSPSLDPIRIARELDSQIAANSGQLG